MGSYFQLPKTTLKKKRRKTKVKNEDLTYHYIIEILGIVPKRQWKIDKKIIVNGELIRNYIFCDFYLEWKGQRVILEYQGSQHYSPKIYKTAWRQRKSNEEYRKQALRDEWLRNYCKNNNIILIEIDGRKLKKNKIREYLLEIFKIMN